ncbi:MAG TPA: pentapeptide repeat-containing protein [Solirubrobacteraceae bacterium]|jgi:uncharacterized protein YjbI with pentapeptide repeats|nr:pentapeptide repeat-containing protein [Solirubrobacteraceae bacterium]
MIFIGKETLAASGGVVSADAKTGQLQVGPASGSAQERLNAYGTPAGFLLQATGGKYVTWSGSAYAATLERDGDATWFAREDAAGGVRIVDLGSKGTAPTQYYWVGATGPLGRTPKTGSPPATTRFTETVITPGLAEILQTGLPGPKTDLSWVYLGAVDLTSLLSVEEADLTGANLAGANLAGLAFSLATLSSADLSKAKLTGMADLTDATMIATNLTGADLSGATMPRVKAKDAILIDAVLTDVILDGASLVGAKLTRAKLTGFSASIAGVDFTGADLTDADFTLASVRAITILGADLTGAQLSNPDKKPSIDLSDAKIDAATNFTSTRMQRVDLRNHDLSNVVMTHADLTGSKLDNTKLIGAELSYADLTGVTLTGSIPMFGANLSNAILTGATLPGAQMGSISLLFRVVNDPNDPTAKQAYEAFLNALNQADVKGVTSAFTANGYKLTAPITILGSTFAPGRVWTVTAAAQAYTVRLEDTGGTSSLAVYQPSPAAILINAYMKDAILTSANLFNVRASGAQIYGNAKLDGQVILEGAQFDSANLAGVNIKQARLDGVNFGHATLTGAQFDGAWLTPDARGGQASFANANLQGASFTDAHLADALFTDAAVCVARTEGSTEVDGVWLFSSPSPATLVSQLAAATKELSLDASLASQLGQGPVSDPVRKAFQEQGVTLAPDALVTIQDTGPQWTIADGADSYRIFEACDQDQGVPALGVNKGGGLDIDFTIPLYLERSLGTGAVTKPVRDAFAGHDIQLGPDARVRAGTMVTDWQVVDSTAGYDLWLGLNLDCALSITGRLGIPALTNFFANHSLPLSRRATVTAAGQDRWTVDNDSNNPFNPVTNYIKCNLSRAAPAGALDVYGSALRVERVGPSGTSEFVNIAMRLTKLGTAELQASTVCPNSSRTKVNIGDKLPFKQWMRAKELPKPPWCIPSADGAFWCPPSGPGRETRETESAS